MTINWINCFLSILLGFSFAFFFKKACKGSNCVLINGPPKDEISKKTYKVGKDKCYKYIPMNISCKK